MPTTGDETPTAPEYYLDSGAGWGNLCRICGQRLTEWETDICNRPRCQPPVPEPVPGFAPSAVFGGDGPKP